MESALSALGGSLQSYIADGFADDCDDLIHQCLQETPVTFGNFSKIFQKMQITCIYHNRHLDAELAELSEEVVNVAKHYMLANTSSFEETVIGLFLVYALLTTQPFKNFAYLRVVDEDVPLIERIEQVARREKRTDVLYVLGRVLVEHSRYHAAVRERGMEVSYRKYLEGNAPMAALGFRPKGVFLRQNEELEVIKELAGLQIRYDAAKAGMKDLNYTNSKLPSELDSSLRKVVSGIIDSPAIDDDINAVRYIKDKAMKNRVEGMKHLIGVNERSPTKPTSSQRSQMLDDLLSSPAKGKAPRFSPRRMVDPNMKKKRAPRKRKIEECSDIDEESYESQSDSADVQIANNTSVPNIDGDEIQVVNENINFESLPSVTQYNTDGLSYEIEIIDELTQPTQQTDSLMKIKTGKNSKLPRDRRELKRPLLRSRLKRGCVDVANVLT